MPTVSQYQLLAPFDPTCPLGQTWFQPECIKAPCPGYCAGPAVVMPTLQLPPTQPTIQSGTHPATTLMNPAAPSTQVVAAGVPANQQSNPTHDFLSGVTSSLTPQAVGAQLGPKIATAALFWIGGKIFGLFGKK
jgi:hypothetical protein